jgi:hypothetical protein
VSHRKNVDERGGHQGLPQVLDAPAQYVVPDAPRGVDPQLWTSLWTSPVAVVLDPVSDREPMGRLCRLYARVERYERAEDNMLSALENPDAESIVEFDGKIPAAINSMNAEIRQLETSLGITPRGRLIIGAAVAAVNKGATQEAPRDDADD